jgi:hypothetical protein
MSLRSVHLSSPSCTASKLTYTGPTYVRSSVYLWLFNDDSDTRWGFEGFYQKNSAERNCKNWMRWTCMYTLRHRLGVPARKRERGLIGFVSDFNIPSSTMTSRVLRHSRRCTRGYSGFLFGSFCFHRQNLTQVHIQ